MVRVSDGALTDTITVNVTIQAVNDAPDQPSLNTPSNNATGVGLSPSLSVTVSDIDSNSLAVTFYGRKSGDASWTLLGANSGVTSGASTSWTWAPPLTAGTVYEWYVTVYDGAATATGSTWSFTTAALPKPPEVTSITQGSGNVVLNWGEVTQDVNNKPTTILKYQVYGSDNPFFEPSISTRLGEPTPPTATTYTHTGGSIGTTNWYYLVRAVNIIGESANSARRTGRFGFTLVPGS